ncbi:hypothetical protein B0I35DRAFT_70307 [Stachybotrys elegans]|uniref:Uncharacterized protein n=1 Tax=Stachybotrys elegans TaxID=80388 RepID=A0A8K0SR79_9HYPO|nr:hypothetical protein B0I35DRAFT_70307 [Stachybotrys elegans]
MPDLNSVPPSPHSLATSRRQSANAMPSPSAPTMAAAPAASSLDILPSNQSTVNHARGSSVSSISHPAESHTSDAGVVSGPGPLRHPRPLTATELHMQFEKEQEAVVNRLTRELSMLRTAQNASVVSNASSTTSAHEMADSSLLSGSGFSIPTTRRHHRTSSAASQNAPIQLGSSYEARARHQPIPLSRQNSASRTSQTGSPVPGSSLDPSSYFQQQRIPPPSSIPMSSVAATPASASTDQLSPGLMPATSRYEETAFARAELEAAKKENEALKRRIRELERKVRERRTSDASRTRSESVSTTASVSIAATGGTSIAGPRETGPRVERERGMTTQSTTSVAASDAVGVPDDEVKVGESAASSGLQPSQG